MRLTIRPFFLPLFHACYGGEDMSWRPFISSRISLYFVRANSCWQLAIFRRCCFSFPWLGPLVLLLLLFCCVVGGFLILSRYCVEFHHFIIFGQYVSWSNRNPLLCHILFSFCLSAQVSFGRERIWCVSHSHSHTPIPKELFLCPHNPIPCPCHNSIYS